MTRHAHTPAPWATSKNASPDYAPHWTIYDSAGERVATAFGAPANARLIAAAPLLLDALEYLWESFESCDADALKHGRGFHGITHLRGEVLHAIQSATEE